MNDRQKTCTCFFIGHQHPPFSLMDRLVEIVERHIREYGVTEFVVGHCGCFDEMAKLAVHKASERHPEVQLRQLLLNYESEKAKSPWSIRDNICYLPPIKSVSKRAAISRANRYMIDCSAYLITYVHKADSIRALIKYAQCLGLHMEDLEGDPQQLSAAAVPPIALEY